nr:MAG TPA: hypothetical protein [Caudoviricetes sp.]
MGLEFCIFRPYSYIALFSFAKRPYDYILYCRLQILLGKNMG